MTGIQLIGKARRSAMLSMPAVACPACETIDISAVAGTQSFAAGFLHSTLAASANDHFVILPNRGTVRRSIQTVLPATRDRR